MFLTIINDSRDQNAFGRQATRSAALFGCGVSTVGVRDDLEAAGNLVDALDAGEGCPGVVLVNVAPRQRAGKKMQEGGVGFVYQEGNQAENGSPFGFFYYGKTLVVSSIDGLTLSLVKKLGIADRISVLNIEASGKAMVERGGFRHAEAMAKPAYALADFDVAKAERMVTTQFRSYEFLPRVAHWIIGGEPVASVEQPLESPALPKAIWWIDSFGNAKTTLLSSDVSFVEGKEIQTRFGALPCFTSLKDVPDGVGAMVIGSSGLSDKRFLEIVAQGGSAAKRFGLASGSLVC
ncbi:MAG: SAM-dependent chlorinase/fluorinase [Candidatus Sungbacteria bacterium]|nr:SAM-dependent chlorinase/fluorinase [Candidatus Sungbacteria bacterium]